MVLPVATKRKTAVVSVDDAEDKIGIFDRTDVIIKEAGGTADLSMSSATAVGEVEEGMFRSAGALKPPYDPKFCNKLYEQTALRTSIEAIAVNVDGFGHRFEAIVDLEHEAGRDKVEDEIERVTGEEADESTVDARVQEIRKQQRREKSICDRFFGSCVEDHSFSWLRGRMRTEKEACGNAFWEVLRNGAGGIARFVRAPSTTVRLMPISKLPPIEATEKVRESEFAFGEFTVLRRFRLYVQIPDDGTSKKVYFKQFGDPRIISRATGAAYANGKAASRAEEDFVAANEMIHFAVDSLSSPYGIPRWSGALLAALGTRASEEVNYMFFDNKAIPPMAVLVNGGRLSKGSVDRLEAKIESVKGRKGFHKILILEAVGSRQSSEAGSGQRPQIEFVPLFKEAMKDALFQQYEEKNSDKLGGAYRVPRLLRGDTRDINRATAWAALRLAEDQVFQPERAEFDAWVNRVVLPELGVACVKFVSQSPVTRDPETMGNLASSMVEKGILIPNEGRVLAGEVFNQSFEPLDAEWAKVPFQFTLAGIQTRGKVQANGGAAPDPMNDGEPPDGVEGDGADAGDVQKAQEALMQLVAKMEAKNLASLTTDDGVLVIRATREEMRSWVESDDDAPTPVEVES